MRIKIAFVDPAVASVDKECTRVDVDRNGSYVSAYEGKAEYGLERHLGSWPLCHVLVWQVEK